YRTVDDGSTFLHVAEVSAPGNSYADTTADASLGSAYPANTGSVSVTPSTPAGVTGFTPATPWQYDHDSPVDITWTPTDESKIASVSDAQSGRRFAFIAAGCVLELMPDGSMRVNGQPVVTGSVFAGGIRVATAAAAALQLAGGPSSRGASVASVP